MNPSRSKHSPAERPPPAVDSPQSSAAALQTPLPSIRQLHPYLPPSGGMSQHFQSEGMSYGFSAAPSYHSTAQSRFESDAYGQLVDSETEDADPQGPPKKKRRRQALSCTG